MLGSLLTGAAAGAALVKGFHAYQRRMSVPPAFPQLLQWAAFPRDGVVWLKDGALMASWEYFGPDLNFATVEQMETLARQFNRVLCALGKPHMLHVDCCRVPSRDYGSGASFGSATGHFLDEVAREGYESGVALENRYFLTLTYMPPEELYQKLNRVLLIQADGGSLDWEAELDHFEVQLRALEDLMPKPVRLQRLDSGALLSYLCYLLKGEFQPVNAPPGVDFVEALFDQEFRPGFEPVLGDTFHRVVSVQGYPRESVMGLLRELDDVAFPYRYSSRIIGTDPDDMNKLIRQRMERWFSKREGAKDMLAGAMKGGASETPDILLNAFADQQALDAQEAFKESQGGGVRFVCHTACCVVRDRDRTVATERANRLRKVFAHRGFVTTLETANAPEALLGSLPGHGHYNVRRVPIRSDYVTRILPLSRVYAGPETNPCKLYPEDSPALFYARTAEHVPYRFCPYVGQVGHTIICGPTGAGKSILMGYEGYRHQQYANSQTIMFDNGDSFALLCEAMNGQRFEVGSNELGFQPLAGIADPAERRWAGDWITSLVKLQGVEVTPTHRRLIAETLDHMAERAAHNPEYLTMNELEVQLQDRILKDAVSPYAGGGPLGNLLNADRDDVTTSRFLVFELSSIIDLSTELVTPLLLYIFHRVGKMLDPQKPTYVGADEFFLLAAKSPVGRKYCMEALRTYRKYNALMTIATQDARDLVPSGRGDDLATVLNSCRTRVYLPNPDALEPTQLEAYLDHGLNEREIQEIADAVPQRDYIARQPDGTRRFQLGLDLEIAFMTPISGLSMVQTADRLRDIKAETGAQWMYHWLRYRGYAEEQAALALEPRHLARAALEAPSVGDGMAAGDGALALPTFADDALADADLDD